MDLFHQFASPTILNTSMIFFTILIPMLMLPSYPNRLLSNRLSTVISLILNTLMSLIYSPSSPKTQHWMFLLTLMMTLLMTLNLIGLLPYTFTPTTQLSLNLALAIPPWLATVLLGLRNQPTHSLAHLLPEGTPTPLIPILIIIETISLLIRPMALGVRLTANLTAGHLLIQLISYTTLTIASLSIYLSLLTFILLILLTLLEIVVAIIQAYVFILLLTLYLQENTYGPPSSCLSHS
uniref:ATP synthase subunit a n=1 Tax=Callulina kreffti TaxID=248777 RepID=S4V212_9NEOB|nr:ATP synthase F0 subunit 6 [Callulina kreffti]